MAAGPVVRRLSAGFDSYWNSRWAVPIGALRRAPSSGDVNRVYESLETQGRAHQASFPFPDETGRGAAVERLRALAGALIWARARVVWADPEAGPSEAHPRAPTAVATEIDALAETARSEVVTASPYLVPEVDMPMVRRLRARGIRIRMLTNSLASTDEVPAYAVYARERRRLLEEGVDLHEVRADAASRLMYTAEPAREHRLALHAKVAVFDRRTVYVGSFNLDPRSRSLNTEVALIVDSPVLARRLLELLEIDFLPANSWHLALDADRRDVVWIAGEAGDPAVHRRTPASAWRRLVARVAGMLPIRAQL